MAAPKLILDYIYAHEKNNANKVYLTQPIGGGQTIDYTWAETVDQARRMAAYLKAQNFDAGARIAMATGAVLLVDLNGVSPCHSDGPHQSEGHNKRTKHAATP